MSTKAIRTALDALGLANADDLQPLYRPAMLELEAIETAAKTLADCSVEAVGDVLMEDCNAAHNLMVSISKEAP